MRLRILVLALLLGACSGPGPSPEARQQRFQHITEHNNVNQYPLVYDGGVINSYQNTTTANVPGAPAVVFLHGTPGDWQALGSLLTFPELFQRATLVAIDRPGWGESTAIEPIDAQYFDAQADAISVVLNALKQGNEGAPVILVGHSYGASLAPAVAQRYPHLVDGLVLASGALAPDLGKPRWYNYGARIWPVSAWLGDSMRLANQEIWAIEPGLQQLQDFWANLDMPVTVIQGAKDRLVNPKNAEFAQTHIDAQWLVLHWLEGQGHFTHVEQRPLIAQSVVDLLEKLTLPAFAISDESREI